VLLAPRHFHAHPGFGQRLLDRQGNVAHLAAALAADRGQAPGDRGIGFGLQLLEGQQLHFRIYSYMPTRWASGA
jgi:hypothetical protein